MALIGGGGAAAAGSAQVALLRADGFNETSGFTAERSTAAVADDGRLNVSVPPFSVLQLRVPLRTVKRSF